MKKLICLVMALSVVLLFAACGKKAESNDPGNSIGTPITQPTTGNQDAGNNTDKSKWPDQALAKQCLTSLIESDTAEKAATWLTKESATYAQDLVDNYNYAVEATLKFVATSDGYDIFHFENKDPASGKVLETGYGLFSRSDDKYLLCVDNKIQTEVLGSFACKTCSGSGSIQTGNRTACAICGGSGVQHNASGYFDPTMNMWMPITTACGGCGGSGWLGNGNVVTCTGCHGSGLVFP